MIIYFSGTGNSRFVADAVAKELNDATFCANEVIKEGKKEAFSDTRPWIFVFPVYVSNMAQIFSDFLRKSEFTGDRNAYFIATCASKMGAAPNAGAEICREKGLLYRGTAAVRMPQNYIALFTMMDEAECKNRQENAKREVEQICKHIREKKSIPTKCVSRAEFFITMKIEKLYYALFTSTKKFYATDACTGCGLCANLCPLNRIILDKNQKPKWEGKCTHCMSCINRCPNQAIEYGKNTIGKTRYYCNQ